MYLKLFHNITQHRSLCYVVSKTNRKLLFYLLLMSLTSNQFRSSLRYEPHRLECRCHRLRRHLNTTSIVVLRRLQKKSQAPFLFTPHVTHFESVPILAPLRASQTRVSMSMTASASSIDRSLCYLTNKSQAPVWFETCTHLQASICGINITSIHVLDFTITLMYSSWLCYNVESMQWLLTLR